MSGLLPPDAAAWGWLGAACRGNLRQNKTEEWESGRVGEWESGRVGEWESGRVGEWESGRVGEWESGRVGEWESEARNHEAQLRPPLHAQMKVNRSGHIQPSCDVTSVFSLNETFESASEEG
jgi:hypothetical protein